jgi:2,4-dienoyl-CoA reductase-like NADH-dependent reductase (Old Yellow Enzyme family)
MSNLFETTKINGMRLSNRFVRSATWEGMATESGACTPGLAELMGRLAKGGTGLIISSHAYVQREGQAGPWQLGIHEDGLIDGLKEMTRKVHEYDGRIVLQVAHAGYFADRKLTGQPPVAFSEVEGGSKSPRRVLGVEEIRNIVKAFGDAARRGQAAGFDGVQIHAAHGYLLSQALSPRFNRREDAYGGSIRNRARILLEVLEEIRGAVGAEYPVLVKINSEDFLDGGLGIEDSLAAALLLEKGGVNAVELSGGAIISGKLSPSRLGITSEEKEAYFKEAARVFKGELHVPLILVGGIRSYGVAEGLIRDGYADYVSMSRPFVCEPELIARWRSGDTRKAECVSDNQCFAAGASGKGVSCPTRKKRKSAEPQG